MYKSICVNAYLRKKAITSKCYHLKKQMHEYIKMLLCIYKGTYLHVGVYALLLFCVIMYLRFYLFVSLHFCL